MISKVPRRGGWDDDNEDPAKVALFKNSVLSRLNIDEYDDDVNDDAMDRKHSKVRGDVRMDGTKNNKKKQGLIRKGIKKSSSKRDVGSDGGSDSEDELFDDSGANTDGGGVMDVSPPSSSSTGSAVEDMAVYQAGINKKRQLVIDSDDDE